MLGSLHLDEFINHGYIIYFKSLYVPGIVLLMPIFLRLAQTQKILNKSEGKKEFNMN